jgi:predicted GNAT family N-acyltransferase
MRDCSVTKKLKIVPGTMSDYKKLAHFHYRGNTLSAYFRIFALKHAGQTVGVIVYTMPSPNLELRNIAMGGLFAGFDKITQMSLINRNIRCIGRVVIEPRFRGLGLAARLVKETLVRVNVPIVEALAVMGRVNSFFAGAGMSKLAAAVSARCVQLIEAFGIIGIEQQELLDSAKLLRKIGQLPGEKAEFIEMQIRCFLQCYGKKRDMSPGIERMEFVLGRLSERPVYYIWFNPEMELIS